MNGLDNKEELESDHFTKIPVHQSHKDTTFFSKEQLEIDPEAKELEETVFNHAKAPKYEPGNVIFESSEVFQIVDDFGNKIPSLHRMTVFNEFGVNEEGQTVAQVREKELEAKRAFEEYTDRHINIQVQMQKLKTDLKALDIEFGDQGLDVKMFKKMLKWTQDFKSKTEEQIWYESTVRQWALGSKRVLEAIEKLQVAKEETKDVGRDKEARQQALINNMTKTFDERWKRDESYNRGALESELDQAAFLATLGSPRAEEDLIKLEESKKIRDARRSAGLEDLAFHSNELRPANPAQFDKVFDEEFHKRRNASEMKKREEKIFNPKTLEEENLLDYTPTNVPATMDFDELVKHGYDQVRKMQDYALLTLMHNKDPNKYQIPDGSGFEKFNKLSNDELTQMIKLAARAEDFLENKRICDQVYLSEMDTRRDDWDSPAMKIARYNRLVRIGALEGYPVDYDPRRDFLQVKELPEGI